MGFSGVSILRNYLLGQSYNTLTVDKGAAVNAVGNDLQSNGQQQAFSNGLTISWAGVQREAHDRSIAAFGSQSFQQPGPSSPKLSGIASWLAANPG